MPRVIHFEIHADEPERAIRFYSSVFGWEFVKFPNAITDYWVVKTGESDQPGIDGGLLRRDIHFEGVGITAFVCTIAVTDLDVYLMKVNTSGGQLAVARIPIAGIGWLAYCKDTEGNLFGLMQADAAAH
ncbi:MAG TPA: VOC family protein [Gammaproteobacteria bacterium]|nr:VOC family protein [Gammaproteobacteria bacterium]